MENIYPLLNIPNAIDLPKEYGNTINDLFDKPVAFLQPDATLSLSVYQLRNIHESLEVQLEAPGA
jgi:hypothetical protein